MPFPSKAVIDAAKKSWTDRQVVLVADAPASLARYAGKPGRVVTVSYSGRAIVDFGDGPWVDIANYETVLIVAPTANATA
jgi:hypothetical protein